MVQTKAAATVPEIASDAKTAAGKQPQLKAHDWQTEAPYTLPEANNNASAYQIKAHHPGLAEAREQEQKTRWNLGLRVRRPMPTGCCLKERNWTPLAQKLLNFCAKACRHFWDQNWAKTWGQESA